MEEEVVGNLKRMILNKNQYNPHPFSKIRQTIQNNERKTLQVFKVDGYAPLRNLNDRDNPRNGCIT